MSDVPPTPLAGTKIADKDEEVLLKSNEGTVPPSQILRKELGSQMFVYQNCFLHQFFGTLRQPLLWF